jgi:chromosome segregation ATPase
MTTDTTETTTTAQATAQAAELVQKLTAERDALQQRKQTAAVDARRLHEEIAQAERAGADAKRLAALRRDRTEQEQTSGDLERVLSHIEAELVRAQDELKAATIAGHADRYNELVEQQQALCGVLDEAVHTIVETLKVKYGLAAKQDHLQTLDIGLPVRDFDPAAIRHALLEGIKTRLDSGVVTSLKALDYGSRQMNSCGELE